MAAEERAEAHRVRSEHKTAEWKEGKPCLEYPEEFFAESNRAQRQAAQVCHLSCPVQDTCLDYALRADERWGVWGGTTEREREKLRKRAGLHPGGEG